MIEEKITYTAFRYQNHSLVFNTPNELCLWRVKTLLTKEPSTIRWIDSFSSNDVLWDIGANIGLYTVYAAAVKKCRVLAFEPESQNYAILNRNIQANKINPRVQAYCIAVSDQNTVINLHLSRLEGGNSGHAISNLRNDYDQGSISYSIDQLIALGMTRPDHIKIDIDGLDHTVIYGADSILNSLKSVLIELNLKNIHHQKLIKHFQDRGFYYDPAQVDSTARKKGTQFEHFREFVFVRYQ
jgi:FkbM family methyltransferase